MNNDKKRVLYMIANMRVANGVTSVIMNHYEKLLDAGYQVDFCAMYDRESPYLEIIRKNGGKYYLLPQAQDKPDKKASKKFMEKLIKEGKYDIVHNHIIGKYAALITKYAKKYKVPYRVFHSHNPRNVHDLHSLLFTLIYDTQCIVNSNSFVACSYKAGKSLFGNRNFSIIKNTINTDEIYYDLNIRVQERQKLRVEDSTLVVGTVCRPTYQKNPFYLIDVFEELKSKKSDVKLLWVGTGELENEIKAYVEQKNLTDSVIFYGNCTQMRTVYSAMDAFLLPSRFEGLGIVYVEAQACGLPTFASDVVPEDTKLTDLIHYQPLKANPLVWAEKMIEVLSDAKKKKREIYKNIIVEAGYDTMTNNDLCEYYNALCAKETDGDM